MNLADSLGVHVGLEELDVDVLLQSVVVADEWANQVPDLHVLLFDQLLCSLILILEVPSAVFVDYILEPLPFHVVSLPHNHILLDELMTSICYSPIV